MQQIFRVLRVRESSFATQEGKPIGEAGSGRCAPRMGRPRQHDTVVNSPAVESELGIVSHLESSLSIASRGGEKSAALPENCHLLPSTAIS